MRNLLFVAPFAATLVLGQSAAAQAGISLGAAVGTTWSSGGGTRFDLHENKHGLVYLRLGLPLVPYGARGEFLVYDQANEEFDTALIASGVMSLNAPLIQPYALVGFGRYGMRSDDANGVSFGAGVRFGGRRGIFIEGRRHDPINRTLVSLGVAF